MAIKLSLVPEPLSELGKIFSNGLKENDLNPACARRARVFARKMEEAAGQLSDKDYEDVLREVEKYWKAQREGNAGHLIEP